MNQQYIIEETAQAIITARDFCGSEKAAVKQVESDYGIKLSIEEKQLALSLANRIWSNFQKLAEVKHPLSPFERIDAFSAIQNA